MKKVYLYLADGTFSTTAEIPDDEAVPKLATLMPVPKGMIKPVMKNNQWQEGNNNNQLSYSDILKPLPTSTQQLIMQQSQQLVSVKTMLMNQNQANAKLVLTNQQQANQIKQLQQMVMNANQQQAVAKSKEEN